MNDSQHSITFDRKDAARMLGISLVTLDRELARQRMPHFRVGRRVLFTLELLEKYIAGNTVEVKLKPRANRC